MPKGTRLDETDIDLLLERYRAGTPVDVIAMDMGVHKATVSAVAKRNGLVRQERLDDERRKMIGREAAADGADHKAIAERYGVTRSYVGRLGRKYLKGDFS